MQYIIFTLFATALVGVFLRNKKTFLNVVLMLGAVPFSLFMPSLIIGGVNPQAALLLVFFLLLMAASLMQPQKLIITIQKSYLLFIFLLLSLASMLWTQSIGEGLGMTIKYATPFLLVVFVLSVVRSQKDLIRIDKSIIICGIILIVLGVINKLLGDPLDVGKKYSGTLILVAPHMSPAPYSFLLAICALLSQANYLHGKKKVWLALFLLFYVGVMFAFVRISMVALLFSSMILYGVAKRNIYITYVAPIVASFIAIFSVMFIKPLRDRMFFNGSQEVDFSLAISNFQLFLTAINTSGRTALWQSAFEYFDKVNIYLGAGSGSADSWVKHNTGALALHCDFLRIYFDLGLIGLVLFLLSHWQLLRVACLKPKNSENRSIHNKYKSLSVAAMLFYMITLFTDNTLNYVANIGMYLFAFIAISIFVSRSKNSLVVARRQVFKTEKTNI